MKAAMTLLVLMLLSGSVRALDPIDAYVRTTYPPESASVRDAMIWLLEGTGWELAAGPQVPTDAARILARPIDPIAQLPRTMTRLDALQVLIGPDAWIVMDRAHRLVSVTEDLNS